VHLAGVVEEDVGCRLYLNGTLIGETSVSGVFSSFSGSLTVGAS